MRVCVHALPPASPSAIYNEFNFADIQALLLPSQLLLQVVSFQDQSNGWGTSLPQLLQQVQVFSQPCHHLQPLLQDELLIFLSICVPIHWALQKHSWCTILVLQFLHSTWMAPSSNSSPCGQALTMLTVRCLPHMTHLMQSGQLLLPETNRLASQWREIAPTLLSLLLLWRLLKCICDNLGDYKQRSWNCVLESTLKFLYAVLLSCIWSVGSHKEHEFY